MSLLSLSNELLVLIAEEIHPATHLNFALASSRLYKSCQGLLSHHKKCADRYGVQSDILPLTVPALLRTVLSDPVAAWHIRSLEFWGHRRIYSHWTTYGLYWYEAHGGKVRLDESDLASSYYSADQLAAYGLLLVSLLYCSASDAALLLDLVRHGSQEPLKVLLIALCPRLRSLKYLEYSSDDNEHHPLKLLGETVRRISDSPDARWPPGFSSVRSVALGALGGLEAVFTLDSHESLPFDYVSTTPMIAPVTLLPSIKTLYIGDLSPFRGQPGGTLMEAYQDVDLPRGRSTLQHFDFGEKSIVRRPTRQDVTHLLGCADRIRSVTAAAHFGTRPGAGGEGIVDWLSKHHATSLESVSLSLSDSFEYPNLSRGGEPADLSIWSRFDNLRSLSVDMTILCTQLPKYLEDAEISITRFASGLPQSLEVIALDVNFRHPWADILLTALLSGQRWSSLTDVYLQSPDTSRDTRLRPNAQQSNTDSATLPTHFPRSVAIARKRSIALHTSKREAEEAWDTRGLFRYGHHFDLETRPSTAT